MKLKFPAIVAAATMLAAPAMADLVVPNMSYRTGPYAANGIPYADGFSDYFTLLNERDGGIGGQKIQVPECETAYNTEKGIECYEALKSQNPLVLNPLFDRHHLSADPQDRRRWHSALHAGLWPDLGQGWVGLRMGVQRARDLLGRGLGRGEAHP